MKCRKVYFISGLGADHRVFKYLQLPQGVEAVHLHWIQPQVEESLPDYARRLAAGIDTSEPFALVGLSFGGMLASEIARQCHPVQTILISSIPVSTHLPGYYRVAGKLRLHRIVPIGFVKLMARSKRLFTAEKGDDKKLLWQIIQESDPLFIRWALGAILQWDNQELPSPLLHIHGTRDEVLPARFTHPTHIIEKAGHMVVMTRPAAINSILQQALAS
ncbi:MAG: alpha/beta hydrolase [Candidatus Pseudobacter hemicellulosilyticus]|uniref:Alpha/beta hydrolase n=1 Tax=Candidatus Pseudobacter hemicellulosilyticus TaxID=3121375 RepID=A0AAJ5WQA4_9BACT|nr:MAG: alpha/beta hydrolase [Pseudobacter sp.]